MQTRINRRFLWLTILTLRKHNAYYSGFKIGFISLCGYTVKRTTTFPCCLCGLEVIDRLNLCYNFRHWFNLTDIFSMGLYAIGDSSSTPLNIITYMTLLLYSSSGYSINRCYNDNII